MRRIRVLIVDDHMLIRRGLRQVLSDAPDIEVAGEAGDGVEAIRLQRAAAADVVLLDIAMEGRDGLEVLGQMRQEFPRSAVLMLSVYPESQFALRAIRGGAAGYLNKGCAPDELFGAVRKAAVGGTYVTPAVAERMAASLRGDDAERPLHEVLSNREYQVLTGLARGRSVSEIAQSLNLSANTVSTYRTRLFEKLGLKNNIDLLALAARNRLVQL
jgi:DNA-binding NarL/FixJ family response regulator